MRDVIVDCALYRNGRRTADPAGTAGLRDALAQARAADDAFLWIGLYEPTDAELAEVSDAFGLHPLAVEDALRAHQRPKLEPYEDALFLVLKPVTYDDARGRVTADELMLFAGDSFVVTVRHGAADPLGAVRDRLERDPAMLEHGPTAVLYAVSDAVVDHYLEVASELRADLEELEDEVLALGQRRARAAARRGRNGRLRPGRSRGRGAAGRDARRARNGGGHAAERIYAFKRQVLEFRRACGPLAEPMARLAGSGVPFVHRRARPFFRDVSDHLTRAGEQVEALDRLVSDILSASLAQTGVRQNDDIRRISAWAAIVALPTLVSGVYGMNFTHMPELEWAWAYPAALLLMASGCLVLYRFFRRRGWL
ncbi:magnesium and cobalt transport protein CorA [Streptomyces sp. JJ36]|uniref:magnesium and cobalt transport protein CorA n=1 Tax=Streptomyces sp. JJ36 TaxID=2736645 RepID=UPI001F3A99A6|nr:magnesium and cobalt transport protein CorA [Streptomyces sp. JJ36]MCF6523239.1 magnesium and cobalt transport protein CorA [Streptomyces sp. JJ36]